MIRNSAVLRVLSLSVLFGLGLAAEASSGDLVYTPINPSFGGSPLNSAHLLGLASAQREATASDFQEPRDDDFGGIPGVIDDGNSDADLFVRQLQGRLLSALAGQVTDAIFGDNPQDSGIVQFGDTTVSFERTLDSIRLVIENAADGTVTEIVVPQLVVNPSGTAANSAAALSVLNEPALGALTIN